MPFHHRAKGDEHGEVNSARLGELGIENGLEVISVTPVDPTTPHVSGR